MISRTLILHVLVCSVLGQSLETNQYCGIGIQTAVSKFTFAGNTYGFWNKICTNTLGVRSLGANIKTHCSYSDIEPSWSLLRGFCTGAGLNLTDWSELSLTLNDEFIHSLPVVEFADIDPMRTWNTSILLSQAFFETSFRTINVFEEEIELHHVYGWAMYLFWGFILVLGMLWRAFINTQSARSYLGFHEATDIQHRRNARSGVSVGGFRSWVSQHLTLPPVIGKHHKERVWAFSVPTRLDTMVILGYWMLNIVLCCVSYELFSPNLFYSEQDQLLRYVADRTGIICYANLPWLWMFSGRNNVFIPLTAWSFGTFNLFHRHIARVATLQAVIHSVAYILLQAKRGSLASAWREKYWYMGGGATIAMSLLTVLSFNWFRRRTYELFLLVHIGFSLLTVVGLFYHTSIQKGAYDGYLWPLVAIWLTDRLLRLARLVYCNVHVSLSRGLLSREAVVTYHESANLLTIEISVPRSSLLRPAPGQHYYIYQPSALRFWENHPFSLASWTSLQTAVVDTLSPGRSLHLGANNAAAMEDSNEDSLLLHKSACGEYQDHSLSVNETLHFLLRPYASSGYTHRLMRSCLTSPDHTFHTRLLLEGAYGTAHPLHTCDRVVFVMGGSGITAAIPYLLDFITTYEQDTSIQRKSSRTKHATLIWTTREPGMIQYVVESHLYALLNHPAIDCHFFVSSKALPLPISTVIVPIIPHGVREVDGIESVAHNLKQKVSAKSYSTTPTSFSSGSNSSETASSVFDAACTHGRPNISVLMAEILDQRLPGSSTGVLVCGPAAMADDTRNAVRCALNRGGRQQGEIRYFEEDFEW